MLMMDSGNLLKTPSSSCSSLSSSSSTVSAALDLYGKRRQLIKIQILEREIGLLQEELKFVDELQPASRCCKELDEFVAAKVDPLVTLNKKTRKSNSCWKNLCYPWVCCINGCFKQSKSSCRCNQTCKSSIEKMGCCKCSSCGVSCPVDSCCCFGSLFCKCKNICCNCLKPCFCL